MYYFYKLKIFLKKFFEIAKLGEVSPCEMCNGTGEVDDWEMADDFNWVRSGTRPCPECRLNSEGDNTGATEGDR